MIGINLYKPRLLWRKYQKTVWCILIKARLARFSPKEWMWEED